MNLAAEKQPLASEIIADQQKEIGSLKAELQKLKTENPDRIDRDKENAMFEMRDKKYGFSRSEIEEHMKDGIMNQGFSVNVAYNGIRMTLAHVTGEHEYFSIEDMMEITGESREEVVKQVENMRAAAVAAGENPDNYAVPVERKILYFPDGFTS